MKEAIGGISIFQIVIVFILFFAGIMCLTINHSIAFGVKDEVVNIIQKNGNVNDNTISEIANKLLENGYRITGKCPDGYDGYNREGKKTSTQTTFCIKKSVVQEAFNQDPLIKCKGLCNTIEENELGMTYYEIVLFYQLDIPGLNDIMNFKMYGSTKVLFN